MRTAGKYPCRCNESSDFDAPWPYAGPWHASSCPLYVEPRNSASFPLHAERPYQITLDEDEVHDR